MRTAELVCVTAENNNKRYSMTENSDGTFTATWGRVGGGSESTTYPIKMWESQLRKKLKRGYVEVTLLRREQQARNRGFVADPADALLIQLQKHAGAAIDSGYTVAAKDVTEAQVVAAQAIVDELGTAATRARIKALTADAINPLLLKLYTVIPRAIKNVRVEVYGEDRELDWLRRKIADEQDLLDVMRQQVAMRKPVATANDSGTLAQALGIAVIEEIDEAAVMRIKAMMGTDARRLKRTWRVRSAAADTAMSDFFKEMKLQPLTSTLWHGSRNQNWLNILKTGLLIRPQGVITTGSMFGSAAIYFANKASKSLGYTSVNGSHWARGTEAAGYLALYDVAVGTQMMVQEAQPQMDWKRLRDKGNFHSVFAKAGRSLFNDEIIIYRPDQCAIRWMVEISA